MPLISTSTSPASASAAIAAAEVDTADATSTTAIKTASRKHGGFTRRTVQAACPGAAAGMKPACLGLMAAGDMNALLRLHNWRSRFELPTLVLIGFTTGGIWLFLELADAVGEGVTTRFDHALLMMLRTPGDPSDPLGPGWLEELGRDLTALGGVGVLTLITLIVSGFLLLEGKSRAALLVLAAVGSGLMFSTLLKMGYDRPRPDLVPHGSIVYTASFPSGHAMLSAVVYLTLGGLLARVQPRRRLKSFLLLTAAVLTVLVGISRVYLGVHWPTDVVAGWTAGAIWASVCWLIASWLQRRGDVEGDDDEEGGLRPKAI